MLVENLYNYDIMSGLVLQNKVEGKVVFKNVSFSYPMRSEVRVLKTLSLNAEPGQTVALVGPSGCGKSTAISLLQRFYDVQDGEIVRSYSTICRILRHLSYEIKCDFT